MEEIKTEILTGYNQLITNPEILRVVAIKKKFVDQMDYWNIRNDDPPVLMEKIKFLGKAGNNAVLMKNGKYLKISVGDLLLIYIEELKHYHGIDEAKEKAHEAIAKLPQLFQS